MPDDTAALAASGGVIWAATKTPRGFAVVIDHGPTTKVATFYTHLSRLLVPETARPKVGPRVHAGEPIGIVGADPLDGEHLMHLHFEVWLGGPSDRVDPAPLLRSWEGMADPRGAQIARNRSPLDRPIRAPGASHSSSAPPPTPPP